MAQQLSGQDAAFLYLETPNAPLHIGSVVIYDQSGAQGGVITFKQVLAAVEDRLRFARCFRQKLVSVPLGLDHPYWVEDPGFDLEFHIRHLALPKPGDWRQLCIQTARLMSRPLDMRKPLWELTVIEGLDAVEHLPPGCFAVVSKIHHAAVDGVSGAEIFAALHDLEPGETRPGVDTWRSERDPAVVELLARAAVNNVTRPVRLAGVAGRAVPGLGSAARRIQRDELTAPGTAPKTPFGARVSPHRVFEGRAFDLADVKQIRKSVEGATVNDVILTIVGGGLRSYLLSRGELPDASLVAMAPVSVRAEGEEGTAGNRVSAIFPKLRTDIEDPLERLRAVHEATSDSKELNSAIGARTLADFQTFGPMRLAGRAARLYSRSGLLARAGLPFNCVVTNVPGPPFPLYFGDAKVVALYGLGPIMDGMGLIHPVFSYLDTITISFTSDRAMIPDPAVYADCLERSFDELRKATGT